MATGRTHVLNGAVYSLSYDVLKDFEPISLVSTESIAIVGKKSLPANDLKGLIGWLKANPGKASAGTTGPGGVGHVVGVFFQQQTGTQFEFVPYRGLGPAMQDMIAGQIDIMFDTAANSVPQVRAGNVKGFAVTAKARLGVAPDLPTADEAGLPGFYMSNWRGLWAPKGTPPDIIAKLNGAVRNALADPAVRKRLTELGQELLPGSSSRRRRSAPCSGRRSSGGGPSSAQPISRQQPNSRRHVGLRRPIHVRIHTSKKKALSRNGRGLDNRHPQRGGRSALPCHSLVDPPLCWVMVSTRASRPFFTSAMARRSAGCTSSGLSIGPSP